MTPILDPVAKQLQCVTALESANRSRRAQADLKLAIKAGEVLVAEVLMADTPDWLQNMSLEKLALAIPRLGLTRYRRIIHRAGDARQSVKIGALTDRQRDILAGVFADWECAQRDRTLARAAA
jgi:hypothetical protein